LHEEKNKLILSIEQENLKGEKTKGWQKNLKMRTTYVFDLLNSFFRSSVKTLLQLD